MAARRADLLAVASVRSAHGVAGELRISSLSGETEHLLRLRAIVLRRGGRERSAEVVRARPALPDVLVTLAGVSTREEAQGLAGWEVWVDRSQAAPLAKGEYYIADLCACGVYVGEERVGMVTALCDAGTRHLLEVRTVDGRTVLVPFSDHFVAEVDVAGRRLALRGYEAVQ